MKITIGAMLRSLATAGVLMAGVVFPDAIGAEARPSYRTGRFVLTMNSGSDWSHEKKFGIAKVRLTPQIAVWLEREDGSYAGELFVTEKAATSSWGKARRPEALPAWSHARGIRAPDGSFMPTKAAPLTDGVSGATPKVRKGKAAFDIGLKLPETLRSGRYRIFVELNNSFDYNDTYAENLPPGDPHENGVNGQPSIVYAADLNLASTPQEGSAEADSVAILHFMGTGHPRGSDGTIQPGSDGLTSALTMVESISVRYAGGAAH